MDLAWASQEHMHNISHGARLGSFLPTMASQQSIVPEDLNKAHEVATP